MPCVFSQNSLGYVLLQGKFLYLPSPSKAQRLQNSHNINKEHTHSPSRKGVMTTKSLNETKKHRKETVAWIINDNHHSPCP